MPNRNVHIAVGVPFGIVFSLYCARNQHPHARLFEAVGGGVGAFAGALFADWIDRADNPNHRGTAHAVAPVGVLAYVAAQNLESMQSYVRTQANRYAFLKQTAVSPALSDWYEFLEILMRGIAGATAGFVAGYASHLILDFSTPRSLPLIA